MIDMQPLGLGPHGMAPSRCIAVGIHIYLLMCLNQLRHDHFVTPHCSKEQAMMLRS